MAVVTEPCYCSREDAMRALDFKDNSLSNAQLNRAIQSSSRMIEGHLQRVFYPYDAVKYLDWPNYQYAYPWRFWLDQHDLLCLTSLQSPSGTSIPLWQVFLEPANNAGRIPAWPYTRIELDRSTVAAWGAGPTPQHSILPTGTWGFGADVDPGGALAASCLATDTTVTVTDSSVVGVGNLIVFGYARGTAPFPSNPGTAGAIQPYTGERVIVSDKSWITTGQTQQSGCSTASAADNILNVTNGANFATGEVVMLDSEKMLITGITGNSLAVSRAWDATILAAHGGAVIWAPRQLTVIRGALGTTAAAWTQGTAVSRHRPPSIIHDLAVAETLNRLLQETSGYAREVGEGDNARPAPGMSLADLWDEAETVYGRKNRIRAI